ncbi:IS200/IS605 family element transposase accessory protein TnpB [Streptomyces sp. RTd22]|uniref:IS200/IS605 family element transposase accessory protein TnpB n=1 Tax=Streptomyces sp. RTd22 TaxID=1841249 RepID=UPI0007C5A439|nr:IS200/IS605 family element transposase accessory protein TnpB [Streptomyces sp. RTd22]
MGVLRELSAPFIVPGPSGVAIRTRLKGLTVGEAEVLRLVGAHLGALASRDLKRRCAEGLEHSADTWAERRRAVTGESSSRWAGSITKATHDQWALSRRAQFAHIQNLEAGVRTITHRLSLPVGAKGIKRRPGGYRTRQEWFAKSRRLHLLEERLVAERADREAGRVRVVRGGKRLAHTRHRLAQAQLTEAEWRQRWEAGRWFLQADGESGKRLGNETIRVTPDGEVSIKLPVPLAHLANARHGRYVLTGTVGFRYRGQEWADRVSVNRAVAYLIHLDVARHRWYVTASWTIPPVKTVPLAQARAAGLIGVNTNADHLAAWRLDEYGNPVGDPRRFSYDLNGPATYRDAQVRHALVRLLHWTKGHGLSIAIEDLDFQTEKTREKHGRRMRFRKLISGMPTSKLRARLVSMAAELGIIIVAVDPAYTSRWGAQHWQKPLASKNRKTTRHHAAAVAIGRRALGYPIRRRTRATDGTAPHDPMGSPLLERSRELGEDRAGHRTVQAASGTPGREETRPRVPGPRTRSVGTGGGAKAGDQRGHLPAVAGGAHNRSGHPAEHGFWHQGSSPLSL